MTSDPMDALDEARRRIGDLREQARANAERTSALSEDARSVVVTVASRHGEVQVTARVGGVIDDLTFNETAEDLSLAELATLTQRTIAEAQHKAMTALAARGAELFGDDSPITAQLRADADRAFPTPDQN